MESRQHLQRQERRYRFVGRERQLDAFQQALVPGPGGRTERFLFHVHGLPGVGKSALVEQLANQAEEWGALTATVGATAGSAMEAMEAISHEFARQKAPLKSFGKLAGQYRKRRDALAGNADGNANGNGNGSGNGSAEASDRSALLGIATRVGMAGVGMVPGMGALVGPLDPDEVAHEFEAMQAVVRARVRSRRSAHLTDDPLTALTVEFLKDLVTVAGRTPRVCLFFDTYESTRPVLDVWLRDLCTTDRYGSFPANVLIVLAGQDQLDHAVWAGALSSVQDHPLDVFTEAETRRLLGRWGIHDPGAVERVVRTSLGLPLEVALQAQFPPTAGDPGPDHTETLVDRFLERVRDPRLREAVLTAALPWRLDEDVFRVVVPREVADRYDWLQSLTFVDRQGGRPQYHQVVRAQMLRRNRDRSPQTWRTLHHRLADAYDRWKEQTAAGRDAHDLWFDDQWAEYHRCSVYHRLCAAAPQHLPAALAGAVRSCLAGDESARRWAQLLVAAGQDGGSRECEAWGDRLLAAIADGEPSFLGLLLTTGLSAEDRVLALSICGDAYEQTEEYDQALDVYDQALELAPDDPQCLYGRGRIHFLTDRYEAAVADLRRAVELGPDGGRVATLGAALQAAGQHEEALAEFNRALTMDPGLPGTLLRRGQCHRELGDRTAAVADFTRAARDEELRAWALAERGDTYRLAGEHEAAVDDFTAALAIDPGYAFALAQRARSHHALTRSAEAIRDLTTAIELYPDDSWAYAQRGFTHRVAEHFAEAVADLTAAVRIEPEFPWAFAERSEAYRLMERPDDALADADRALELKPDYVWALQRRALTLTDLGRYDASLVALRRADGLDPGNRETLAMRGVSLSRAGRHQEALADLDRVLALSPDYAYALAHRGVAHREVGHLARSLADLRRAVEILPDYAWARAHIGVTLATLHRYEEALAVITDAQESSTQVRAYAARAELLRLLNRPDEARAALRQAVAGDPDDSFVLIERAVLETVTGGAGPVARLWDEAERAARADRQSIEPNRLADLLVVRFGRADPTSSGPSADEFLAAGPSWYRLFVTLAWLDALAAAPGAGTAELRACRTALAGRMAALAPGG